MLVHEFPYAYIQTTNMLLGLVHSFSFQEVFDSTPLGISRTWERHDDLVDITTTALTAVSHHPC